MSAVRSRLLRDRGPPHPSGSRSSVVEPDSIDHETVVAGLGIWISSGRHGGGYAREAIELVVGYAFSELRVHRVTANAYATNTPSRKEFDAAGFVQEGVGREGACFDGEYHDTHYFGLLEHEWSERTGDRGTDPERTT